MPTTHDSPSRFDERTAPDDRDPRPDGGDEDSPIIFEFRVPAEEFIFADLLREIPDDHVEFEKIVPTDGKFLPYLWITTEKASDVRDFEERVANNPKVAGIRRIATFDHGMLYRMKWAENPCALVEWLRTQNPVLVQAEGHRDNWMLKVRLQSRDDLTNFRAYCDENGIPFDVVRLYELTDPKMGQYNITAKQRELLIVALEMGYFEIPRRATLAEVADEIGISTESASERLRRGSTNLVTNTLTIGQPTGIGFDQSG